MEAVKYMFKLVFRYTNTGVAHCQFNPVSAPAQCQLYFAYEGMLISVAQQIEDYLFPHLPIHIHWFRQCGAGDDKLQARLVGGRTE